MWVPPQPALPQHCERHFLVSPSCSSSWGLAYQIDSLQMLEGLAYREVINNVKQAATWALGAAAASARAAARAPQRPQTGGIVSQQCAVLHCYVVR